MKYAIAFILMESKFFWLTAEIFNFPDLSIERAERRSEKKWRPVSISEMSASHLRLLFITLASRGCKMADICHVSLSRRRLLTNWFLRSCMLRRVHACVGRPPKCIVIRGKRRKFHENLSISINYNLLKHCSSLQFCPKWWVIIRCKPRKCRWTRCAKHRRVSNGKYGQSWRVLSG